MYVALYEWRTDYNQWQAVTVDMQRYFLYSTHAAFPVIVSV